MSSVLTLENISVAYGKNVVVNNVSLQLKKGEIGCLLGPSGCGKTTVLRSIAGFEPLQSGAITMNGHLVSDTNNNLPPEKRNIGMVFQDFALFPHLNIEDNIAFGLTHLKKAEQQQRIKQLLEMIGMEGFASRYPHELSGGQQQRIALARAIAPKPELLLMDEPFSSMDIELREELAKEVREILNAENITAILVTHDQKEAFVIADNIGVMKDGNLLQWTDDYTLYHQPATPFIADFIGQGVFIDGEVINEQEIKTEFGTLLQGKVPQDCKQGCPVQVFLRPDDIVVDQDCNDNVSNDCKLLVTVVGRKFEGADYLYTLQTAAGTKLLMLEHSHNRREVSDQIGISLDLEHVVVFPQKNRD